VAILFAVKLLIESISLSTYLMNILSNVVDYSHLSGVIFQVARHMSEDLEFYCCFCYWTFVLPDHATAAYRT